MIPTISNVLGSGSAQVYLGVLVKRACPKASSSGEVARLERLVHDDRAWMVHIV